MLWTQCLWLMLSTNSEFRDASFVFVTNISCTKSASVLNKLEYRTQMFQFWFTNDIMMFKIS